MEVLSHQQQSELIDEILTQRLDTVLPQVFRESGIDGWLIISREYCEDPMFKLLTPAMYLTARRISILFLYCNGNSVERYCCCMADEDLEKYYENIWKDRTRDQFEVLNEFLLEKGPEKIGIDSSRDYAYFDGLNKSLYDLFMEKLDQKITSRFVSAEKLGIRYTQTRSELEIRLYPQIMKIAEEIIEEAFCRFIRPGVTTCWDVEWFMKERIKQLKMDYWFSPDVNLQNGKSPNPMQNGDVIINWGDLVHCDFGITYLSLNTDTQRLLYVLKEDETGLPEELEEAYEENMRFHQIVREAFSEGKTGNQVFHQAIQQAEREGIKAMLYTHPLGNFGHAPGPTIGLFSNQGDVYPAGELTIEENTAYALELNTRRHTNLYGRDTFMFTEESVLFHEGKLEYLAEPKGIYLI